MSHFSYRSRRVWLAGAGLAAAGLWSPWVQAQQTTLYDPQPPANSGYVRILTEVGQPPADVLVNQKARVTQLPGGQPSAYLVMPAGQHTLAVKSGGQQMAVPVNVVASRSITVMLPKVGAGVTPVVIDDKVNGNRLKAMISAYMPAGTGALEVWTADGQTKVMGPVAPGASAALVVNPIDFEFVVTAAGQKKPLGRARLSMAPGGAYSIVLGPLNGDAVAVKVHANTVERYTGQ